MIFQVRQSTCSRAQTRFYGPDIQRDEKGARGRPARASSDNISASEEPWSGGVRNRLPAAGNWEGMSMEKGRYYTGT